MIVHGCTTISPCPASANLKVHLLVQHHRISYVSVRILLRNKILHIDWAFPIHVPVASRTLTISTNAIRSPYKNAYLIIKEVLAF